MSFRVPVDIMRRGPQWHLICYSRGSGQYPGGNPEFTGNQPPGLLIPCEDGTCQHIDTPIPNKLIRHDSYTKPELEDA